MKIVMIGHSNAGKTTYMSLMYRYMTSGYRGFRIRAENPQHGTDLLGSATGILAGRYPPPSSRRETYEFVLSHRKRDFFRFTWQDYRGGALTDRGSDAEVAALMEDLTGADGVIVFADAHRLATEPRAEREVRRLAMLAQRSLDGRTGRVPLVIAYTKADLVRDNAGRERATQPFSALAQAARDAATVEDTAVWVACGRRPVNVHVPVLWCLAHGVSSRVAGLEASMASYQQQAMQAQSRATLWNSLSSWWEGTTSYAQQAQRLYAAAHQDLQQLEPLRKPAEKLGKAMRKAHR